MNEDFVIPFDLKAARKLHYLSTISNIDIDPRIEVIAQNDLIDLQELQSKVPEVLKPFVKSEFKDWYQTAHDHDYKALLGIKNPGMLATQLLIAGLSSGSKLLIVTNNLYDLEMTTWKSVFANNGLKHQTITRDSDLQTLDKTADIIIATVSYLTEELLASERDRILIKMVKAIDHSSFAPHVSHSRYKYLVQEFPKTLFGFYTNIGLQTTKNYFKWYSSPEVGELVSLMYDAKVYNMFSPSDRTIKDLEGYGFTVTDPVKLSKAFGIVVDSINIDMDLPIDTTIRTDHTVFTASKLVGRNNVGRHSFDEDGNDADDPWGEVWSSIDNM